MVKHSKIGVFYRRTPRLYSTQEIKDHCQLNYPDFKKLEDLLELLDLAIKGAGGIARKYDQATAYYHPDHELPSRNEKLLIEKFMSDDERKGARIVLRKYSLRQVEIIYDRLAIRAFPVKRVNLERGVGETFVFGYIQAIINTPEPPTAGKNKNTVSFFSPNKLLILEPTLVSV